MIYPDTFEHKIGFDTVRAMLAAKCVSPLGVRQCEAMSFGSDYSTIVARLKETSEMLSIVNGPEDFPIGRLRDVTPMLKRITPAGTFIPLPELLDLRMSLEAIGSVVAFMGAHRADGEAPAYPLLGAKVATLDCFPEVSRAIDRLIDRYGNVKDNASPTLAEIRASKAQLANSVNSIMRRVMSAAVKDGLLEADASPSLRDGRLVIPVSPMYKRKIRGIVHDESASGKTVFIEPAEVVEANNRLRELEMDERREIMRLLVELADMIRPHIPSMLDSYDVMGQLDFIRAKAIFAQDTGGALPQIHSKPEIEWYHATHPVLLQSLRRHGKEIVPLDIHLSDERRLLIISGPNAGGKSVCLKTVGIIQYMTQCGVLPCLYENSHMGIFDDMMIDIGDDQSIEDDLSTYSSHLRNMKAFLAKGRATTLVLIDEFGGGTEPQIGGAIAQSILKEFNRQRMWGVITTHYQNLKKLAEETRGLVNGSMLYDRQLMMPLFKLSIGHAGSSFALEIARKIGLPRAIIDDAQEIVGSDYVNLDKYLLDVARDKRYWEHKREQIRIKERKMEQTLNQYEEAAEQLRNQRREIINDAQREAKRIIEGSGSAIERTIKEIRDSQAERESTLQARQRLEAERRRLEAGKVDEHPALAKVKKPKKRRSQAPAAAQEQPVEVVPGAHVRLDGQNTVGEVLEVNGKQAVVAFGLLKTTVAVDRLRPTAAQIRNNSQSRADSFVSSSTSDKIRERQLAFRPEIDVRGMRADEAIQAVTYFIDDAIQFNARKVRILHGTGSGILRSVIRQYLSTVPGITSYHDEHVQFGGAGITVAEFE